MRWRLPTLAEFQADRAAGALRSGPVEFGAPGASGALRGEKAAGVASVVRYTEAAPRWNGEPGTFTGDVWGGAFWMVGTDLFVSSGARLLADLRGELARPAGEATGEPPALAAIPRDQWRLTVCTFLSARARASLVERSASPAYVDGLPLPLPSDVVPRDWLRLAIWYTYHRDMTSRVDAVRMPRDVLVPAFDASLGAAPAATGLFRGFVLDAANREGFEPDSRVFLGPFPGQVQRGPEIDVGGGGSNGGRSSSGDGGGGFGAVLAAVGIALLAGEDK